MALESRSSGMAERIGFPGGDDGNARRYSREKRFGGRRLATVVGNLQKVCGERRLLGNQFLLRLFLNVAGKQKRTELSVSRKTSESSFDAAKTGVVLAGHRNSPEPPSHSNFCPCFL